MSGSKPILPSVVKPITSAIGYYTPDAILKQLSPEMAEQKRLTNLIIQQNSALRAYIKGKKNLPRGDAGLKILKEQVDEFSASVLEARSLVHIQPSEEFTDLHQQLMENEKVHPVADLKDLRETRLGGEGQNKDCQAFLVDPLNGPKVLTGIYRYHSQVRERHGRIWAQDLPGDVDDIKSSALKPLTGNESVTGYYSISSKWPGSGPVLIGELGSVTPEMRFETTISPARDFYKAVNMEELLHLSDQDIRAEVLKYLIEDSDGVRNFHLGNGACVGWIHVNRDSKTDPIIINYIYKRDLLDDNQKEFDRGKGKIPLSPELFAEIYGIRDFSVTGKVHMAYGF
ncbi:MAG: hypothetical protein MRY79_08900 [Alphaproteobacteria bacterium]|nr:hypothetical protein [Alphaproteobacteria bacterium]